MYIRILTSAVFAGAAAGLIAAALQLIFVQPVLLHAELYETGQLVHFGADGVNGVSAQQDVGGINLRRDGLSVLFTMLTYTGFALVLVAAMSLAQRQGHEVTARSGLLWGLAGFVSFHLAPGFSLAPEVPGVAAVELGPRQIWWTGTIVAAALAMWLISFGRTWLPWGGAIVLLLVPHLIGAPEPAVFAGPVPTEIGALFAARALGVAFAAWVVLGTIAAYLLQREDAHDGMQTA